MAKNGRRKGCRKITFKKACKPQGGSKLTVRKKCRLLPKSKWVTTVRCENRHLKAHNKNQPRRGGKAWRSKLSQQRKKTAHLFTAR